MRRRVAAILAMVFSAMAPAAWAQHPLQRAAPETVGLSGERLARIATVLQREVEANRIPGAVVAVARRGRLVYFEAVGFQDRAAGVPMRTDSIFALASMTKPWVAVATMMLAEEGRLSLGDPVERFLPELANRQVVADRGAATGEPWQTVPARRPITLLDLLRHTAGLSYGNRGTTALHRAYPQSSNAGSTQFDASAFIARLGSLPLHYQPGTTYEYSLGMDVAGIVVERLSGQTLGGFLSDRLFRPLGMRDTGFVVPPDRVARLARGLTTDPDTGRPTEIPDRTRATRFECGGGCGAGTAADYLRFAQMLLDGGALGRTRVLQPASVRAITSDQLLPGTNTDDLSRTNTEGYGYGLTVAVRRSTGGPPVLGNPGAFTWSGAYGTTFWVDPAEGLAVVFMAQAPGERLRHNQRLINSLVYSAINP